MCNLGARQGCKFKESNLIKGKNPERATESKQVQESSPVARMNPPHTVF